MKVKSVTKVTQAAPVPVYDMTVTGTENFCLANGAVAHNSKDVADAATGVIYGLSTKRAVWVNYGVDPMTSSIMVKKEAPQ